MDRIPSKELVLVSTFIIESSRLIGKAEGVEVSPMSESDLKTLKSEQIESLQSELKATVHR